MSFKKSANKNPQKNTSILIELESTLKEWTSTSVGRRHFLRAMPLLLAACATEVGQHRYKEGDNSGQAVSLTPEQEKRMSEQVLPSMKKEYPPIQDRELQRYIAGMGNKVVQANGLGGNPYNYTFQVVQTPQVNAFALPAGPIFVTAPLIAMCDTEAELAGVIGHEVGHIKARHTAERIHRAEKSKGKSIAYLLGGGVLGGVLGYGIGKLICSSNDKKCRSKALQIGAMTGAGGAQLISKFGFMAHSREDELEADRVGFRTSVKAGYNKDHVGRFYEKLLQMEAGRKQGGSGAMSAFADALSTHPPSQQRVSQMRQMAQNTTGLGRGVTSTRAFESIKLKCAKFAKG